IYSREQTVSNLPDAMTFFGTTFRLAGTNFTYGTIFTVLLFVVAWYVLSQTGVGRHVYALGNNPEAARLTGINTRRLLLGVYAVAAVIYGVAGLLLVARTGVGDPQAGQTDNLDSITAVVLGGTSLFGGRGGVIGTIAGVLILSFVGNIMTLEQVSSWYQQLIKGVIIITAVAVYKQRR